MVRQRVLLVRISLVKWRVMGDLSRDAGVGGKGFTGTLYTGQTPFTG